MAVGIATCYGLDGPGIEYRFGRDFLHPFCTMGAVSLPGGKTAGGGVDHPPPSSAEAKESE